MAQRLGPLPELELQPEPIRVLVYTPRSSGLAPTHFRALMRVLWLRPAPHPPKC